MTEPIVSTTTGDVQGVWRDASAAFLGIPFAAPPVGELRFAAPAPVAPWEGVLDATAPGATPQRRPFAEVTSIPEPSFPGDSTLNVNVFTPRPGEPDARLPVLVWIHGGGYKAGSPSSPWYDGAAFNRDGVVTVSVSYRLGFDGFGFIEGAPGNRGFLDQAAGLAWVRDNIGAFGGDPDRVTIAGQSAGGGSVLGMYACPPASGLFHAGISHSGALSPLTADDARERSARLAEELGVPPTLAGFRSVSEDAILDATEALAEQPAGAGLPPEQVVDGMLTGPAFGGITFVPYLDPETLTDPVAAVAASDLPLVMGTVAHEFSFIGQMMAPLFGDGDITELLRASVVGPIADEHVAAHPELSGPLLVGQLMTDKMFRGPLVQFLSARADAGGARSWAYDFRWPNADSTLVAHCAEIPFAFDCLAAPQVATSCGPDAPQALADEMHADWVQFITTHAMPWEPWTPQASLAKVYDTPTRVEESYRLEGRVVELLEASHG
ncbi:MAG: carboxylesterase family protein [Propionibacteriaceae bacterium]|nr:carboxylesterase family protein [Propionibacteriaceae bacterium]